MKMDPQKIMKIASQNFTEALKDESNKNFDLAYHKFLDGITILSEIVDHYDAPRHSQNSETTGVAQPYSASSNKNSTHASLAARLHEFKQHFELLKGKISLELVKTIQKQRLQQFQQQHAFHINLECGQSNCGFDWLLHRFVKSCGQPTGKINNISNSDCVIPHRVDLDEPNLSLEEQCLNLAHFCEVVLSVSTSNIKVINLKMRPISTSTNQISLSNHADDQGAFNREKFLEDLRLSLKRRGGVQLRIKVDATLSQPRIKFTSGWTIRVDLGLHYLVAPTDAFKLGALDFSYRKCRKVNIEILQETD